MKLQNVALVALTGAMLALGTLAVAGPSGSGTGMSTKQGSTSKTTGSSTQNTSSSSQNTSNNQPAPSSAATITEPYVRPPS